MRRAGLEGGTGRTPAGRLRRSLFGVRAADVQRELDVRDAEIEELRRELAALWQTYAQHDRAIREALSPQPEPPAQENGGEPSEPGPSPAERRAAIEAQLGGLDEALAAIEQATQTLERAYRPPAKPDAADVPSDDDPGAGTGVSRPEPTR